MEDIKKQEHAPFKIQLNNLFLKDLEALLANCLNVLVNESKNLKFVDLNNRSETENAEFYSKI